MQQFDFDNATCSFGCSASFCRIYEVFCSLGVWFVNCVQYFDKTSLVCKTVFQQLNKTVRQVGPGGAVFHRRAVLTVLQFSFSFCSVGGLFSRGWTSGTPVFCGFVC